MGALGVPDSPHPKRARDSARAALIGGLLGFSLVTSLAPSRAPYSVATLASWLAAMGLLVVAASPRATVAPWPPAHRALDRRRLALVAALTLVVALALALRVVSLESYPPLFHGDEGEMGVDALAIARGSPDAPPLFGTGWLEHPSLHFYLEALSIDLFGVTIFSLRLVTALWGTAGVIATFFAGRELVSTRAGVLAAAIAASAPVDLQLSRVSLNNVETAVLSALAVGLLARSIRLAHEARERGGQQLWDTGAPAAAALAGLAAGLALYFYFASRLVPVVLALILAWAAVRLPRIRAWIPSLAAVLVAGFALAALPLAVFAVRNPSANGLGRLGTFFVLSHLPDAYRDLHVAAPWQVLAVQLVRSLAQFFVLPDGSTFFPFNAPILVAPVAALFACGLGVAMARPRLGNVALLVWFWVTLVAGNVLLSYAPYTPRIVGALPAVYILAAGALDAFWRRIEKLGAPALSRVAGPAVGLVLAALTVSSVHDYFFVYFSHSMHPAVTAMARFIASLPDGTYVYDLPDGLYVGYGSNRYLGYRISGEDLNDPPRQVSTLAPRSSRVAFVVFPKWADELPAIVRRFPGGTRRDVVGDDGRVAFTTYVAGVAGSPSTGNGRPAP